MHDHKDYLYFMWTVWTIALSEFIRTSCLLQSPCLAMFLSQVSHLEFVPSVLVRCPVLKKNSTHIHLIYISDTNSKFIGCLLHLERPSTEQRIALFCLLSYFFDWKVVLLTFFQCCFYGMCESSSLSLTYLG